MVRHRKYSCWDHPEFSVPRAIANRLVRFDCHGRQQSVSGDNYFDYQELHCCDAKLPSPLCRPFHRHRSLEPCQNRSLHHRCKREEAGVKTRIDIQQRVLGFRLMHQGPTPSWHTYTNQTFSNVEPYERCEKQGK
jgi:hypothetical protein